VDGSFSFDLSTLLSSLRSIYIYPVLCRGWLVGWVLGAGLGMKVIQVLSLANADPQRVRSLASVSTV
jgi:hypothetical protein